jgi:hypothetical protein
MRALRYDGELRLDAAASAPVLKGDEALLKIRRAGICNTDLEPASSVTNLLPKSQKARQSGSGGAWLARSMWCAECVIFVWRTSLANAVTVEQWAFTIIPARLRNICRCQCVICILCRTL